MCGIIGEAVRDAFEFALSPPVIYATIVGTGSVITGIALNALGFDRSTHIETATFLVVGSFTLVAVAVSSAVYSYFSFAIARGNEIALRD
jgi:hypothetical protein